MIRYLRPHLPSSAWTAQPASALSPLLRKDLPDLGHLIRFQVEGFRHLFVELAAGGVIGADESLQGRHLRQTQASGLPDIQEAVLVDPHLPLPIEGEQLLVPLADLVLQSADGRVADSCGILGECLRGPDAGEPGDAVEYASLVQRLRFCRRLLLWRFRLFLVDIIHELLGRLLHLGGREVDIYRDAPCDDRENCQDGKRKAMRGPFHAIPLFVLG